MEFNFLILNFDNFIYSYLLYNMMPMAAKFEVYVDAKKQFRFRLKAANGEIIAVGEGYTTKKSCLNGIASVKKNAPIAEIVEVEK